MQTKDKLSRLAVVLISCFLLFGISCDDDTNKSSVLPTVETNEVSNIEGTQADGGGKVLDKGSSTVLERGLIWSRLKNPTYNENEGMSFDGQGLGSFTSKLTELQSGVLYYVQAFAYNSEGVGYGNVIEFTTIMEFLTEPISKITMTSAVSGGKIPSGMTENITERGIVWSTSDNPTIENCIGKTSDGTGQGNFISQITDLEPGTQYYVKAYAMSNETIKYGDLKTFTTELYEPIYQGETFYMPFDNSFVEMISKVESGVVGSPTFSEESFVGSHSYQGAQDSYLTFSTTNLLAEEFSAAFWYKSNGEPGWAGILTIGPPDENNPDYPDVQNNRTSGFRFFREGAPGNSVFKLSIGFGEFDVFYADETLAVLDLTKDEWVHIAFSISPTNVTVFFDGNPVIQGELNSPIDWTNCDLLSIASGQPRFTEWQHFADHSLYDELRLFDVALNQSDIKNIMKNDQD